MIDPRNLVGGLIPMYARIPFPERSQRRLVLSACRSGDATEGLNCDEIIRVPRAREAPRWSVPELGIADQDEHIGECQSLGAHRPLRRRRWPPLTGRGPS